MSTIIRAYFLLQKLKSESVEFIVAPYEADAQLAYLSSLEPHQGGIAAIITEDSDLIAYGCQAVQMLEHPPVFFFLTL